MFSRSTKCLKGEKQEELPGRVSVRSGRGRAGRAFGCQVKKNSSLLTASAQCVRGVAVGIAAGLCTEGSGT